MNRLPLLSYALLVIAGSVSAHEVRPALLKVSELSAGQFLVRWKVPAMGNQRLAIDPRFAAACVESGERVGGGRNVDDRHDLSVGFVYVAPMGKKIDGSRPLAVVHAANDETAALASQMLREACVLGESAPPDRAVIYKTLEAD